MAPRYRSSIPKGAREVTVRDRCRSKAQCRPASVQEPRFVTKKCIWRGRVVGMRTYENGELCYEHGLKNGKKHGTEYMWMGGKLLSAEPYVDGAPHGVARQWSPDGKLIGTYRMCHGTGLDLWRMQREDGSVYLAEAVYWRKWQAFGPDWRINEDQKSVWREVLWAENEGHGVTREWNTKGRLCRGFPEYYISGRRVSKRQYAAACKKDPTMPPLRPEDDKPQRTFPPEVARHLCFPKHKK